MSASAGCTPAWSPCATRLGMSPATVAKGRKQLLREVGYPLLVNSEWLPSTSPAERNAQFEFI